MHDQVKESFQNAEDSKRDDMQEDEPECQVFNIAADAVDGSLDFEGIMRQIRVSGKVGD